MNPPTLIVGIIAALVILAAILGLRLYLRIKWSLAAFPVRINYVRRDQSPQGPFLYLELKMKNSSGKSIFVSEVQQRHINGPFEIFVLQDAQGRTKRSPFEIRDRGFNNYLTYRNYWYKAFPVQIKVCTIEKFPIFLG